MKTKNAQSASSQPRIASRLLARELSEEDISRVSGGVYTKVYGLGEMGDWFEP